jgi:hypothetical protein
MGKSPVEKKRKRKVALQKKRKYDDLRAVADRFPEIRIHPTDAPTSLVDAIRTAVKQIRLSHAGFLNPADRDFFRDARRLGFGLAGQVAYAKAHWLDAEVDFEVFWLRKVVGLGQLLYNRIPGEILEDNILYHCIDVDFGRPAANTILISFRSLLNAKTRGGTAYYSPYKPTLLIAGKRSLVSFSKHAIERIFDRTVRDWRTFHGSHDAFAVVANCVYFEDCSDQYGEPCFTLYNACKPGLPYGDLPRLLLGEEKPGKAYYFRIGYCPAAIEGDMAKAITLKSPGMTGTPERVALRRARLSLPERDRLNELAKKLEYRELAEADNYSLIKWFHEHGVPQVVAFDHEVFRFD